MNLSQFCCWSKKDLPDECVSEGEVVQKCEVAPNDAKSLPFSFMLAHSESVSYEIFCGGEKSKRSPVPTASKFYVSIVIVGVVKDFT